MKGEKQMKKIILFVSLFCMLNIYGADYNKFSDFPTSVDSQQQQIQQEEVQQEEIKEVNEETKRLFKKNIHSEKIVQMIKNCRTENEIHRDYLFYCNSKAKIENFKNSVEEKLETLFNDYKILEIQENDILEIQENDIEEISKAICKELKKKPTLNTEIKYWEKAKELKKEENFFSEKKQKKETTEFTNWDRNCVVGALYLFKANSNLFEKYKKIVHECENYKIFMEKVKEEFKGEKKRTLYHFLKVVNYRYNAGISYIQEIEEERININKKI
jgi:hypothetical protein